MLPRQKYLVICKLQIVEEEVDRVLRHSEYIVLLEIRDQMIGQMVGDGVRFDGQRWPDIGPGEVARRAGLRGIDRKDLVGADLAVERVCLQHRHIRESVSRLQVGHGFERVDARYVVVECCLDRYLA